MPRDLEMRPSSRTGVFKPGRAPIFAVVLFAGLAILTRPSIASPTVQTFGPGKVSCQPLVATQMDCLLAASRITPDNRNVVAFGVNSMPLYEQALFRKWCLAASDDCIVTVTGRRASPQSTRLSAVISVHWTRLSAPVNDAAAQAVEKAPSTDLARPSRLAP